MPVQRRAADVQHARSESAGGAGDVHAAAAHGISGSGSALPHLDRIQSLFGHHDVSHVQAHVGGKAAEGAAAMGAEAYATGDRVAFARSPDLHTAAHEAAHVVQQRAGVQLKGGVGEVGDSYEQHADAVADRVVAGKSAEDLLNQMAPARAGSLGGGVQRVVQREAAAGAGADAATMLAEAIRIVEIALDAAHGETLPEGGGDAPAAAGRFTPEQVAHLEDAQTKLRALHGRPADEIRAATQPIIDASQGRSSQPASTTAPGAPVQRAAALAPLAPLALTPPGWVLLAAVVILGAIVIYQNTRTEPGPGPEVLARINGDKLRGNTIQLAAHLARLLGLASVGGVPSGEPPKKNNDDDPHWWKEIKAFLKNIRSAIGDASRKQVMRELGKKFTEQQILEIERLLAEAAKRMGEGGPPPFLP